jgi:hypothetical protein
MSPLWFPCRVCGTSTEGVDTYVVCGDCVRDFDNGFRTGNGIASIRLYDERAHAPLTPEDEVRLRKLLDW